MHCILSKHPHSAWRVTSLHHEVVWHWLRVARVSVNWCCLELKVSCRVKLVVQESCFVRWRWWSLLLIVLRRRLIFRVFSSTIQRGLWCNVKLLKVLLWRLSLQSSFACHVQLACVREKWFPCTNPKRDMLLLDHSSTSVMSEPTWWWKWQLWLWILMCSWCWEVAFAATTSHHHHIWVLWNWLCMMQGRLSWSEVCAPSSLGCTNIFTKWRWLMLQESMTHLLSLNYHSRRGFDVIASHSLLKILQCRCWLIVRGCRRLSNIIGQLCCGMKSIITVLIVIVLIITWSQSAVHHHKSALRWHIDHLVMLLIGVCG